MCYGALDRQVTVRYGVLYYRYWRAPVGCTRRKCVVRMRNHKLSVINFSCYESYRLRHNCKRFLCTGEYSQSDFINAKQSVTLCKSATHFTRNHSGKTTFRKYEKPFCKRKMTIKMPMTICRKTSNLSQDIRWWRCGIRTGPYTGLLLRFWKNLR